RNAAARGYPGGAILDVDALRSGGSTGRQFRQPSRIHQPGDHPVCRRQFPDHGRAPRTAGKLAAQRRSRSLRLGIEALRHARRCRYANRTRGADALHRAQGLPMIRWLLWILGGILLGGIVHLATVLLLPSTATRDAYDRLLPIAPVNSIVQLPAPAPEKAVLPFMDPAFSADVCRYDLRNGPLKLTT